MSDRSVEDELISEVRQFGSAMRAALQRHAQALNWLERRKARKDISRLVREERRSEEHARTQQLSYTRYAVDRFRTHSNAVASRANDPNLDHGQRDRDAAALREHRDRLAGMFVANERLTMTERGIALDGLDAATAFPEFETGNLFARAHKVKGVEALHHRARVAREIGAVQERSITAAARQREQVRQHEQRQTQAVDGFADDYGARTRLLPDDRRQLARLEAASVEPHRFRATVAWTDHDGITTSQTRRFGTEHAATDWMRRDVDGRLSFGETVGVQTWDAHDATAPLYSHTGGQSAVAVSLTFREEALARSALARDVPDRAGLGRDTSAPQAPVSGRTESPAAAGIELETVRAERDSLRDRLGLSIEHNAELSDSNGRLTRQLSAVRGQFGDLHSRLDALEIERDKLRDALRAAGAERESTSGARGQARQVERDSDESEEWTRFEERLRSIEADEYDPGFEQVVREEDDWASESDGDQRRVVEEKSQRENTATPAAEQRQRDRGGESGGSALSGYRAGRTLADAMARHSARRTNGAEFDGAEHEGMYR
ncbi:hypothetical protein [Nocardia bovistercoris]|uniref:Uncharacterized protein n=1 Tax=Nocardia bovistercoris TaxID=2785916 RepID=A0A931N459_9NOCA|nr:hypothetical protein [Nocardia bovistercoris]MBH0777278.1 hypothetical protein [Nocardia bovistercoris]